VAFDWLDRLLGPNPRMAELAAERDMLAEERDTLAAEVTALAEQVDKLAEKLANSRRDLRAEVRKYRDLAQAAHEPIEVGKCRKIGYLHREDAAEHAAKVAIAYPGEIYETYRCSSCQKYPVTGHRPWHVGHAATGKNRFSMWADGTTLYYKCGCQFGIKDHGADRTCLDHAEAS
jgi:hypothetical protein